MSQLIEELKGKLDAPAMITGADLQQRPGDMSGNLCRAEAIVRPKTTAEVAEILKLCNIHNHPVVTMGGLTGLAGGCATRPGDIGLSMERMTGIEEVDVKNHTMTVQAGVPLQSVQEAAAEVGLMFPVDLGARGSATIGGNIATNAGGNRVLRFGMTRQLVLGIEAVLADGTVIKSLGKVLKDNSGYDLKQLFIGSEGTLGVVTRAVLRLIPEPRSQNTALVAVPDFESVIALLHRAKYCLGSNLSGFELMWDSFFQLVMAHRDRHRPPFADQYPFYVLIETLGSDIDTDAALFENALEDFYAAGLIADAVVAKSNTERDALWAIREDVEALISLYPMFLFDISLALDNMQAYLADINDSLKRRWPESQCVVFGHLGDGNLHLVVAVGDGEPDTRTAVEEIVYGTLRDYSGVVSAEHGIGLEKKDYLSVTRSDAEIAMMKCLKRAMDPKNLLNPGKIFAL
ncbi:FAD-binding oxidoreductase [Exilibacterium tricleocarpae]|uniref:FAD-binding oxidoreductase n=1 Tax=Exilibacterium tricleocarpae TaxID=2591008 RepID=A0A545T010_9GAMM|nr:FAD-binding oxidoreductase [Exilibacterium tricleocarpae]TQV70566.1 FAD-binding oxidoreductase [Exilibacterium tricleocarpae]